MKTIIKHEVVARASIFIAFGYEKNNPAKRAGEKNNLTPILPEKKISGPDPSPSPPPPPPRISNGPCLSTTCFSMHNETSPYESDVSHKGNVDYR